MAARIAELRAPPPKRFSRQWYLDHAGTVAWTLIITVLVWVYADIHFTGKRKIDIKLRIENKSNKEMVVLDPRTPEVPIRVEIQGRRSALDRLEQQPTVSFDAARKFPRKGKYPVDTTDFLQELPAIRQSGKVLAAQPETLTFETDEVRKLTDRKVRLELPGAVEPENVTIKPDRVTLYIPSSQVRQAPESIVASPDDVGSLPEGKPVTREVPLVKPTPESHLEPPKVIATFTIIAGQRIRRREFVVPIRIQSPKQWLTDGTWDQYQFEEKPPPLTTVRIEVGGPQIQLDRLRPEDIDVFLTLTNEHKKPLGSWLSGQLQVEIRKVRDVDPSVLKVVGPLPEIQFKLVRTTPTPTPATP